MIDVRDDIALARLFLTGAWDTIVRLIESGPLVVLGPKCTSADCVVPARVRVCLPTLGDVPPHYCERHAQWALQVYRVGFGITAVKTEQIEYRPASEDDASVRFALLELE